MSPAASGFPLVLFDCDGTLVDSQHAILAAMTAAWHSMDLGNPDPLAVRRLVGLPVPDAVAALRPDSTPEEITLLSDRFRGAFADNRKVLPHTEPLYPGIFDTLCTLQAAGFVLGVVTGKSRRGLMMTLDTHSLHPLFSTLQTCDDAPGKPHPAMVLRALAETGAEAAATLVVGDTTYDMLMARNARVQALGVGWGYHDAEDLHRAGACAVVDAGEALTAHIFAWRDSLCAVAG